MAAKKTAAKPKKAKDKPKSKAELLAEQPDVDGGGQAFNLAELEKRTRELEEAEEAEKEEAEKLEKEALKDNVIEYKKPEPEQRIFSTKPYVKDQINLHPHTVETIKFTTYIFDLGEPKELAEYNKWRTKILDPDSGFGPTPISDLQFTGTTWKALIEFEEFRFLKIV